MAGRLAELRRERQRDGFGHRQAPERRQIGGHPARIDLETLQRVGHRGDPARRTAEQRRPDRPFRLPGPEGAFVLFDQPGQQCCGKARRARRIGQRHHAAHGIALVGHGGRAATTLTRRLRDLPEFELHHQGNITRNLASVAAGDRERGAQSGHRAPPRLPGQGGEGQIQFSREGGGNRRSLVAERSQRTSCATELQHQGVACIPFDALEGVDRAGEPLRRLQAERNRRRRLQERAREHDCVAMRACKRGRSRDQTAEIGGDAGDSLADLQDMRGVDDVLAGCPEMHEAGRLGCRCADMTCQELHERHDDRAGLCGVHEQCSARLSFGRPEGFERARNRGGCLGRDDPGRAFGPRERRLERHKRGEMTFVRHRPRDGRRREHRVGERDRRHARHQARCSEGVKHGWPPRDSRLP